MPLYRTHVFIRMQSKHPVTVMWNIGWPLTFAGYQMLIIVLRT